MIEIKIKIEQQPDGRLNVTYDGFGATASPMEMDMAMMTREAVQAVQDLCGAMHDLNPGVTLKDKTRIVPLGNG